MCIIPRHPSTLWFHPTSVISHLEKPTLCHYHDFNFLNYRNFLFTIDSPCFYAWCNIRSGVTWKSMDEGSPLFHCIFRVISCHRMTAQKSNNKCTSGEINYRAELSVAGAQSLCFKGKCRPFPLVFIVCITNICKSRSKCLFRQCFHADQFTNNPFTDKHTDNEINLNLNPSC